MNCPSCGHENRQDRHFCAECGAVQAATDAREAAWFAVDDVPSLAFDHAEILAAALEHLRGKLAYQPIGFELLPQKFTLSQLQHLFEVERKYKQLAKDGFHFEI